jgi:glucose/arabinose dehydrogenase
MKKLLLMLCSPIFLFAQSPAIKLNLVAGGFGQVVDIVSAGDSRLFIVDGSHVKILLNGLTFNTPFINLSDRATWIMAVAFHPNYAQNGYFYVKYKANDASCVISRFSKSESNDDLANINSESILFSYPNNNGHEGGDLEFGKDGYLYTATGDGAPGARGDLGDEFGNAQNMATVKGKMLRFDVDSPQTNYIPVSNPYQGLDDNIPDAIIASGLRNPWKFSFDRQTGDVWVGDVGQDSYEEVSFVEYENFLSKNYGWSCYEGNMPHLTQNCTNNPVLVFPIITFEGYNFNGNLPASVTGGYVYRGNQYPALNGFYCYADFNSGKFWLLKRLSSGSITNDLKGVLMNNPITFGEDHNGELYVATFDKIYQITSCDNTQNLILNSPITTTSYYSALNSIQSTSYISNDAKVIFNANNKIELNAGFKTDNGVTFTAQIVGCQ